MKISHMYDIFTTLNALLFNRIFTFISLWVIHLIIHNFYVYITFALYMLCTQSYTSHLANVVCFMYDYE